jgi:hypothetical protein
MTLAHGLLYLVQWVFYLIRLVFSLAYGVLQFISKPGSRPIVILGTGTVLFLLREQAHPLAYEVLRSADPQLPGDPWVLDSMLGIAFLLAACGYVVLSRMLSVVLGTFPPIIRPLRPVRRLSARRRPIRPVVVRQVVPRLRRGLF